MIFQGLTLLNVQSEHAEPVKLEFKGDYVTVWEIRLAFLVVKKPFVRCDEATKVKKVTESTGRLQEAAPRTSSNPNITPTLHTLHSLNIYLKRQPFDVVRDSFHLKWAIGIYARFVIYFRVISKVELDVLWLKI